jgi:hypothetical protein
MGHHGRKCLGNHRELDCASMNVGGEVKGGVAAMGIVREESAFVCQQRLATRRPGQGSEVEWRKRPEPWWMLLRL